MRNRHALEPMVLPSQAFCDCWYSPSTVDEVENICARPSNLARIPPGRLTSRNYESALFPTFSELQLFVHFMRLEHPVRIGSTPNTQDTFLFTLAWHLLQESPVFSSRQVMRRDAGLGCSGSVFFRNASRFQNQIYKHSAVWDCISFG